MRILHVMDAVIGTEGECSGPSGKARNIGAVLASEDAEIVFHAAGVSRRHGNGTFQFSTM
jgi:hypothetical protein